MILESKDPSFRLKEKISPKAFAKIETKEEKVNIMIYVENVKYVKSGYRIILIQDDLTAKDIGRVLVNESGKGEFKINFEEENLELKSIALTHEKDIPLIGFKGKKIDNYEELINKNIKRNESVVEDLDKEDEIETISDPIKETIEVQLDEKEEVVEKRVERQESDTELIQEEVEIKEQIEEEAKADKKKNKKKFIILKRKRKKKK